MTGLRTISTRKRRLLVVAMVAGWMLSGAEINSAADLPRADRIVIAKSTRTLTLLRAGQVLKTYKVALGGQPVGAKDRQGDNKTPEGLYTIDSRNQHSQFHLSLHISYPSAADRERARRLGVNPGGDIFIHGGTPAWTGPPAARRYMDWTLGCIAVTNAEIEEIWAMVPVGTKVEIRP
jgi:murein L,D-transpeptidase YafK